jgi:chromate reductase
MARDVNLLGFAGSLRAQSYNKGLLNAALELLPANTKLEIFDLATVPAFNQDNENNPPEIIKEFKAKIRTADAILIASPEYNYSISGVLKNAIDWASRPYGDNAFEGKAVAIMSASIGMLGGARGQYHLRQSFVFLNIQTLNRPEVMVPFAQEKYKDGVLIDETSRKKVAELVAALVSMAQRMKSFR